MIKDGFAPIIAPQQSWGEFRLILPSECLAGNRAGLGMVPVCWALTERTTFLLPHIDPRCMEISQQTCEKLFTLVLTSLINL